MRLPGYELMRLDNLLEKIQWRKCLHFLDMKISRFTAFSQGLKKIYTRKWSEENACIFFRGSRKFTWENLVKKMLAFSRYEHFEIHCIFSGKKILEYWVHVLVYIISVGNARIFSVAQNMQSDYWVGFLRVSCNRPIST